MSSKSLHMGSTRSGIWCFILRRAVRYTASAGCPHIKLAEELNTDLLILPSSVHEVLLLPDDKAQNYDFYRQMVDRKGVYPKSSMPSTQDYVDAFTPYAEQGT